MPLITHLAISPLYSTTYSTTPPPQANLHLVPEEVRTFLASEEFVNETVEKFNAVDEDGNGVLSADELFEVGTVGYTLCYAIPCQSHIQISNP